MSKKCKKLAKEKRLSKKRAIKAANKAKYAAYKLAGTNYKTKRFRKHSTKRIATISHPNGDCGNIGCKRCNPTGH